MDGLYRSAELGLLAKVFNQECRGTSRMFKRHEIDQVQGDILQLWRNQNSAFFTKLLKEHLAR